MTREQALRLLEFKADQSEYAPGAVGALIGHIKAMLQMCEEQKSLTTVANAFLADPDSRDVVIRAFTAAVIESFSSAKDVRVNKTSDGEALEDSINKIFSRQEAICAAKYLATGTFSSGADNGSWSRAPDIFGAPENS